MRKPKPDSYREAHLSDTLYYIFIACTYTGKAFGKVRAVTRPLKIHVALEPFGLTYAGSIPTQFLFFHYPSWTVSKQPSGN